MDYNKIGKNIKKARKSLNWTQAYFSEKTNLSTVYISQIESGKRTPSLETICKLAKALNVTIDSLVDDPQLPVCDNSEINKILLGRNIGDIELASNILKTIFDYVDSKY